MRRAEGGRQQGRQLWTPRGCIPALLRRNHASLRMPPSRKASRYVSIARACARGGGVPALGARQRAAASHLHGDQHGHGGGVAGAFEAPARHQQRPPGVVLQQTGQVQRLRAAARDFVVGPPVQHAQLRGTAARLYHEQAL